MKSSPALPNRTAPVFALFLLFCLVNLGHAQEKPIQQGGREMNRAMLNEIRQDLVKNYYDPKFQGFDVQARSDGKARAGHWRHQFGERHECADVPAHFGMDTIVSYAAEMSRANLIMRDGKSLKKAVECLTKQFCLRLRTWPAAAIQYFRERSLWPARAFHRKMPVIVPD